MLRSSLLSDRVSWVERLLLCIGTASYPFLLGFFYWPGLSAESLSWSWGLAAEHAELELEHWSHLAGILLAAMPLSLAYARRSERLHLGLLAGVSLLTSLPYFIQPAWQYDANDSWLSGYAWQLDGVKVAVAPVFLAAIWQAVVCVKGQRG